MYCSAKEVRGVSRRKRKLEADLGRFMQQYRRKRHPNWDPNDRSYNRELEAKIKRMRPEELDELLRSSRRLEEEE